MTVELSFRTFDPKPIDIWVVAYRSRLRHGEQAMAREVAQRCRERALECTRLSQTHSDSIARNTFAAMAEHWLAWAVDAENATGQVADKNEDLHCQRQVDGSPPR